MKKLFTFLALLVTAVTTAMAATYTADLKGIVTQYGWNSTEATGVEAEVTATGTGQYTIILKQAKIVGTSLGDLTFEGVKGQGHSDGTVAYTFDGDLSVSNAAGNMGYTNGSTHAATLTGASKDGQLYLDVKSTLNNGLGSVSYELVYGTEITAPTDPDPQPSFTSLDAYVQSVGDGRFLVCDDNNISLANAAGARVSQFYMDGGELYLKVDPNGTAAYSNKDLHVGGTGYSVGNRSAVTLFEVADPSATGPLSLARAAQPEMGKTYVITCQRSGGYKALSNVQSNVGVYDEQRLTPADVAVSGDVLTMDADRALFWTLTSTATDPTSPDQPGAGTASYTNTASVTYNGTTTDFADVKVDVTTEADGSTTLTYNDLTIGSNLIGTYTARNVAATAAADGSVTYTFDGTAELTDLGAYASMFGIIDSAPFSFTAVAKDGTMNAKFVTHVANADATIIYGTDPTQQQGGEAKTVSYTGKATADYGGIRSDLEDNTVRVTTEADGSTTITYVQYTRMWEEPIADYTASNVTTTRNADGSTHYTFDGYAVTTRVNSDIAPYFNITEGGTQPFAIDATLKDGALNGTFATTMSNDAGSASVLVTFGSEGTTPTPDPSFTPLDAYVQNVADGRFLGADANNVTLTKAANAVKAQFYMEDGSLYLNADMNNQYSAHDLHLGGSGYSLGARSALTLYEVADPNATGTLNLARATQPELGKTYVITADHNGAQALSNAQTGAGTADQRLAPVNVTIADGTLTMAADKALFWTLTDTATDPSQPQTGTKTYTNTAHLTYLDANYDYPDTKVEVTTEADGSTTVVYKELQFHHSTYMDQVIGDYTATHVNVSTAADGTVTYTFDGTATLADCQGLAGMGALGYDYMDGGEQPWRFTAVVKGDVMNAKFVTDLMGSEGVFIFGEDPTAQPEPTFTTLDAYVQSVATGTCLGADAYNVTLDPAGTATKAHFYMSGSDLLLKVDPEGSKAYSNRDLHLGGSGYSLSNNAPSALTLFEVADPDATGEVSLTQAKQPELGKVYVITALRNGAYQALSNEQTNVGQVDEQRLTPVDVAVADGVLTTDANKSLYWKLTDDVTTLGIGEASANAAIGTGKAQVYTLSGARVSQLQRGVNILRTADGKTVKVLKK